MRDVLAILSRPVLASLGAAAALFAGQTLLSGGRGVILDVLVKLMAFGLLYAALWVGIPGGKRSSAELLRLGQEILPERFRADSKPKRNTGRERRHG